jgi:hypothetical protein
MNHFLFIFYIFTVVRVSEGSLCFSPVSYPVYFGDGITGDFYISTMDSDPNGNFVIGGTSYNSNSKPFVAYYSSTTNAIVWSYEITKSDAS